jgi:hypothetical protein
MPKQDAVTSGGPLLALLGFLILPFVWSVPEALVTAELATAFPEDSGCALNLPLGPLPAALLLHLSPLVRPS